MALDKKHKAFRFPKVMPIDANNLVFEQAFARFLVLVRTKGLPITSTTKATLHPEDLVEVIAQDKEHFQGIKDNPQRKRLLEHWIASDFATCVKEGRGHAVEVGAFVNDPGDLLGRRALNVLRNQVGAVQH